MKTNLSAFDGWFRTLLFIIALCCAIIFGTTVAWLLIIPAVILFATAVLTWCPIYAIFKINTEK